MAQTPIKDNKVYGDETALKRLQQQPTKQANGELVPQARREAGRPPGPSYRGPSQASAQQAPAQYESPYSDIYEEFGRSVRAAEVGAQFEADPLAGPWLRAYGATARSMATSKGSNVRESTPFLEE